MRKAIIFLLTAATVTTAVQWAWSRTWQGAIGGWSIRAGSIVLANECVGYDLVLRVGKSPNTNWRPARFWHGRGFGYSIGVGYARYVVPFWFAFSVFATYPAIALTTSICGLLRRERRRKQCLCEHCGYNLTGNESGFCPECGKSLSG